MIKVAPFLFGFVLVGLSFTLRKQACTTVFVPEEREIHIPLTLKGDSLFQRKINLIEPLLLEQDQLLFQIRKQNKALDSISVSIMELQKGKKNQHYTEKGDTIQATGSKEKPLYGRGAIDSLGTFKSKSDAAQKLEAHITFLNAQRDALIKSIEALAAKARYSGIQLAVYDTLFDAILFSNAPQHAYQVHFKGVSYRVFMVTSNIHQVQVHGNTTKHLQPLQYTWSNLLRERKQKPLVVMNGGMYNPDGTPVGLLIQNGSTVSPLNQDSSPIADNFHLYPNGVFFVDSVGKLYVTQTKEYRTMVSNTASGKIWAATQSGPMLVINGAIHNAFTFGSPNTNIRNGVGIIEGSDYTRAVLVLAENRVNLYDFALFFKAILKCNNALYLDGVISKMYIKEDSRELGDLGGSLGPVISVSAKKGG